MKSFIALISSLIISLFAYLCFSGNVLAQSAAPLVVESDTLASESAVFEPQNEVTSEGLTQPEQLNFHRGQVLQINKENRSDEGGYPSLTQDVTLRLSTGQEVLAFYTLPLGAAETRMLQVGDQVIVNEYLITVPTDEGTISYDFVVTDLYRFPSLVFIVGIFIAVIVAFAGMGGLRAIAGLGMTIAILLYFVVPRIAEGVNPLAVSLVGSIGIACISLYLAHGFNRRTTIALVSTLGTLVLALIAAVSFVSITKLFGLGSEESLDLQYGAIASINLRGLLLAGIVIGALGVLDDITTAQAAAVEEISRADNSLRFNELYHRGMSVGKEHITSLVNTLALAYAGTSLPMLLLFTVYQQPLWVTLNSEFVIEEVVRTVVGSLALALAVPITTGLAAWYFGRNPADKTLVSPHHH